MASRVVGLDTVKYPIDSQRDSVVNDRLTMCYAILGYVSAVRSKPRQTIYWHEKVVLSKSKAFNNSLYHESIGSAFLNLNEPAKAVSPFREAVRLKPEDINYRVQLMIALVRSGDAVAGEAEAKALLRLDSVNVRGTQTLAVAVLRQGRYAEAWKLGQQLEKITPSTSWEAPYFYAR